MMPLRIEPYNKLMGQKGATLVEFCFVGFLFFLLIFGIIELGILLYNQQVITNAGREGARYGIVARPVDYKINKNEIEDKVRGYAEGNIVSFGDKQFNVEATFDSKLAYCEKFRDKLVVEITYQYSFLFLPFANKSLGSTAIMVCE